MLTLALLATALLFGGMVLHSFGFAAREVLMLVINYATDAGAKVRFKRLRGLSVALVHIGLAGAVLARFVGGAFA
ncbi:hypothetical protein GIY56_12500 [Paracoccus sp. YIM 132242]|uniref:Uncharacterized protein n=1 Tax=Paracoccus lichenicola TaxID=2665644 RepID=A0A6L6HPR1_9RHOB|nr:hypothetical protein [Paracoccus lichenicola]MTE01116.1 hypothetical protein [Paracoccus lichenicola]